MQVDCSRLERGNIQEVKKKLVFSSRYHLFSGHLSLLQYFVRPTSFSLVNLHKHLLGAAPKFSHGAEVLLHMQYKHSSIGVPN